MEHARPAKPVTERFSWRCGFAGEPALSELLRDPIAHALMAADHVEHGELDALLATARRHLRERTIRALSDRV